MILYDTIYTYIHISRYRIHTQVTFEDRPGRNYDVWITDSETLSIWCYKLQVCVVNNFMVLRKLTCNTQLRLRSKARLGR